MVLKGLYAVSRKPSLGADSSNGRSKESQSERKSAAAPAKEGAQSKGTGGGAKAKGAQNKGKKPRAGKVAPAP